MSPRASRRWRPPPGPPPQLCQRPMTARRLPLPDGLATAQLEITGWSRRPGRSAGRPCRRLRSCSWCWASSPSRWPSSVEVLAPANGPHFFTVRRWSIAGPVSSGRCAFICGTFCTSAIALLIAVPVEPRASPCSSPSWRRAAAQRRSSTSSTCWPRCPRWSSACGACSSWPRHITGFYGLASRHVPRLPVLGQLSSGPSRPAAGQLHDRRAHPGHHDHPDHHLAVPRGVRHRAAADKEARPRPRRHPLGDDPGRRAPAQPGGMVGAVMLGLGRAMGETIAVALVIGCNAQITANVLRARRLACRR